MTRAEFERRRQIVRGALRDSIGADFLRLQVETQMHPLLVLQLASEALGAVYRDIACAHQHGGSCECGWRPDLEHDLALLKNAIADSETDAAAQDLRHAIPAGNA
ncbi:MAG: hypothetical protein JWN07_3542 [Hyphomicrobiales bacterium]|nr:hypothetical protein [Hyphomicrobiales bacterium]